MSLGASGADPAIRARIDAPRRRNALTLSTVEHLYAVLGDDPHSTVLLGSTTDDIFSSGADLDVDDASRAQLSDLLYACYEQIVTRPGIVIAVVEGPAVGGGAQLCAAADIRTISHAARWRWTGPGHGLAVGAWILCDLLGRSRGLDLALTSRWLEAEEAVAAGLAARVEDDPWQKAQELAESIGRADSAAVTRVKQIATRPSLIEHLSAEREQNRASWSGAAPSAREAAGHGRSLRA
ncbi:MAG: enoyl-CoA hydratase/isomerase family protein [Actinomycetota bacterium]|nr:enoyl-CoA hydratase/isomerase family protein [Actinomycetota bacterium]